MCGIVGILDINARGAIDSSLLVKMRDVLVHRGPDESGLFTGEGVALAHRRLSIIDVSSGQQPFSDQAGYVTVTYNGEIYNFPDLTRELKEKGYRFCTRCDTEVIVHAWKEWGPACVNHFRGMFAFALWDSRTSTLFLARDRLGIKPLLYAQTVDGHFIFASEIKALLKHPGVNKELHEPSIENFMTLGYVPEPHSIYSSIKKLEAGHTLLIKNRKVPESQPYWDVSCSTVESESYESSQLELVRRLKESIDIRMVADVPLGAFLSGGVDSSSVVSIMSSLVTDPLHTCSIGFDVSDYDETTYAKKIAAQYKTNHHHHQLSGDDHSQFDLLANIFDEPFADSSALPTLKVCELARRDVVVALSGDGADEMLGGYRRHKYHMQEERVRNLLPFRIRKPLFELLGNAYPKLDWAPQMFRAKTTFQSLAMHSADAYLNSVSRIPVAVRKRLYSDSFYARLDGFSTNELFHHHAKNANTDDPMLLMQYMDIKTYLVDDILTKVDRTSMAHSLEVRVPFLDHKLVEWMIGLPTDYKLRKGVGKAVLKSAMESRLPDEILYRQKMGFSVPLANWLRGPMKARLERSLQSEKMLDSGIFNQRELNRLMMEHSSGMSDHSTALWSLLMFESFLVSTDAH